MKMTLKHCEKAKIVIKKCWGYFSLLFPLYVGSVEKHLAWVVEAEMTLKSLVRFDMIKIHASKKLPDKEKCHIKGS